MKRTEGHNRYRIMRAVAVMATALVVLSCQNDGIDNSNRVKIVPVIERKIETAIQTRATLPGYSDYTDNRQTLSAKAIAFDQDNNRAQTKDSQGIFAPQSSGGWRSTLEVEVSYNYNVYAYSRTMPSPNDVTFTFGNANNVSLTFNGLYLITTDDPLVSVAAKGKLLPDTVTSDRYPTLVTGEFNVGTIETGQEGDKETTVKAFLAMDHLYSKATIKICVDPDYNQLRTIRIKDVQIYTPRGTQSGSHTYTFANNKLVLASTNSSMQGDTIKINLFNGPTAVVELETNQNDQNDKYVTLGTDLITFGSFCFLTKTTMQPMSMKVTYDVYDKKGFKVRANQTAVNDHIFDGITHDGNTALRGHNYNINVMVGPTYLYQLSDDDVEMGLTVVQ